MWKAILLGLVAYLFLPIVIDAIVLVASALLRLGDLAARIPQLF